MFTLVVCWYSLSPCHNPYIVAGTSGDNIGMCHWLREYQHTTNVNIHHVLCDPYLVSFPFYTIPICLFLKIHRIFYLLVSSHFYIHSVYVLSVNGWCCMEYSSVERWRSSYREKCPRPFLVHGRHGNTEIHMRLSFTFMHCIVCKFEKWRSSYRKKCLRPFFVDGCHGNTQIHMRTKFHLHALHGLQVWEVKK